MFRNRLWLGPEWPVVVQVALGLHGCSTPITDLTIAVRWGCAAPCWAVSATEWGRRRARGDLGHTELFQCWWWSTLQPRVVAGYRVAAQSCMPLTGGHRAWFRLGLLDLGVNRAACWRGGGCRSAWNFQLLSPGVVFRTEVEEQLEMRNRHLLVEQVGDSVCICAPQLHCSSGRRVAVALVRWPDWPWLTAGQFLLGPAPVQPARSWTVVLRGPV